MNSAVVAHPVLEPLTDIFSLPAWLPFSNIFSVGDVLIALGVAVVIVRAMRAGPEPDGEPEPDQRSPAEPSVVVR